MVWQLLMVVILMKSVICFSNADCDHLCTLSIVESIPENLTYPSGSPSHGSTYSSWKSLLKAATQTVDVASFYWLLRGHGNISDSTDKQGADIFNGLSELKSLGVKLRIVQIPPSKEYPNLDSQALQDMGVASVHNLDITKLLGSGILHTKLWVVDSKHFYLGSANLDWRSLTQVKELGISGMNCECLAQDLQRLFNIYWYVSTPGNSPPAKGMWPDEFTALFNMSNPAMISINKSLSSSAFLASSPPPLCASGRTNDIDALLEVINTAKSYIYIAVMDYIPAVVFTRDKYYWPKIDDALREAAYKGVSVRLLGSYWNHTDRDMLHFMQSLSDDTGTGHHSSIETLLFSVPELTTKTVPYTRVNHNKYMVTDNAAYIGTSNWSGDYFISTGGISCTIRAKEENTLSSPTTVSSVQQQLKEVFDRDWYSPYTVNVTTILNKYHYA